MTPVFSNTFLCKWQPAGAQPILHTSQISLRHAELELLWCDYIPMGVARHSHRDGGFICNRNRATMDCVAVLGSVIRYLLMLMVCTRGGVGVRKQVNITGTSCVQHFTWLWWRESVVFRSEHKDREKLEFLGIIVSILMRIFCRPEHHCRGCLPSLLLVMP